MEIMYSKKEYDFLNKNNIIGVYKDKVDLEKLGVEFSGIVYDDEWTVKRFLNGYKINEDQKILKIFDNLDINRTIFNKKIKDISKGYFKLVLLVYALLNIKDTIYLDYFDKGLTNRKKNKVINYLKNNYKNIVVISNDLLFLNSLCYYLIVFKNKKIVYNDLVSNLYNSDIKIDYPNIIDFINLANKNGANLSYTIDNKELVKDIYRSIK